VLASSGRSLLAGLGASALLPAANLRQLLQVIVDALGIGPTSGQLPLLADCRRELYLLLASALRIAGAPPVACWQHPQREQLESAAAAVICGSAGQGLVRLLALDVRDGKPAEQAVGLSLISAILHLEASRPRAVAEVEREPQWLGFVSLLPQLLAPFALSDSPMATGLRDLLQNSGAASGAFQWLGLCELRLSLTLQLLLNLNAAPRDARDDTALALRQNGALCYLADADFLSVQLPHLDEDSPAEIAAEIVPSPTVVDLYSRMLLPLLRIMHAAALVAPQLGAQLIARMFAGSPPRTRALLRAFKAPLRLGSSLIPSEYMRMSHQIGSLLGFLWDGHRSSDQFGGLDATRAFTLATLRLLPWLLERLCVAGVSPSADDPLGPFARLGGMLPPVSRAATGARAGASFSLAVADDYMEGRTLRSREVANLSAAELLLAQLASLSCLATNALSSVEQLPPAKAAPSLLFLPLMAPPRDGCTRQSPPISVAAQLAAWSLAQLQRTDARYSELGACSARIPSLPAGQLRLLCHYLADELPPAEVGGCDSCSWALIPPLHFDAPQLSAAADTLLAVVLRTLSERTALQLSLFEKALLLVHHHLRLWIGPQQPAADAANPAVNVAGDMGLGAAGLPQGRLLPPQLRELRAAAKKPLSAGGPSLADLLQQVLGLGGRQAYTPAALGMAEHQMQLVRLLSHKLALLLEVGH